MNEESRPEAEPEFTPAVNPAELIDQPAQFAEPKLPGFEEAPRHLPPMEADQRYQDALATLQQSGDRAQFDTAIQPLLQERLEQVGELPFYESGEAKHALDLKPYLPGKNEVVDYGYRLIDLDRVVVAPYMDDWSGDGRSKEGMFSRERILSIARDMAAGKDFTFDRDALPATVVISRDNEFYYSLDGGSHRVAAAKLLGRSQVYALLDAYESSFVDNPQAMAIDRYHRQLPVRPQRDS